MENGLIPSTPRTLTVSPDMVDYPEAGEVGTYGQEPDDDLPKLLRYYEDAEEASCKAREKAERDRDYVDNKQLTQEEVDKLRKRGQPPIALNVIRSRAAFLAGLEKKQRRDPKAYPRNNPEDVPAAEAFTEGMRYVVERADYLSVRSMAWKNVTIEGFGGIEVAAIQKPNGDVEFNLTRIPWDRLFYDPHSAEPDFSDARYIGQVMWMDYDEALARAVNGGYVDEAQARQILDTTLATAPAGRSRTYDDKPAWTLWADTKRKRVRIVMIWHKETDGWEYCEFTKAGKLAYAEQPYVDQDGESYCPWLLESANVDRDNNRYGEMRHLIDPQDEINKRRSKALHQSVSRGVIAEYGAVEDVNAVRGELAKPDFYIEVAPGVERFEIVDGQQLVAGQAALLQDAMNYIMQAGPNAALLGKGTQDQSGRAIEAQQAGGLVEQSDLMDSLRRLDKRVFTVIASMIKQFWNDQKWIRVTDDDQAPRWVGLNEPMYQDPTTGQVKPESEWRDIIAKAPPGVQVPPLQQAIDPQTGQPMLNNHVASLDMDIIVSDAPDTITLDGENYQAFMQLMTAGLPPPVLKLAIEMHPGLNSKRKKQLTDMIDQMAAEPPPPGAQEKQQLAIEKEEADIVATRAEAYASLAAGEASLAKAGHGLPYVPPVPDVAEGFGRPQHPQAAPQPPGGPQPPMAPPGSSAGSPGPQGPPPGPMQHPGAPPPHGPAPGPMAPAPGQGPHVSPLVGMMSGRPQAQLVA